MTYPDYHAGPFGVDFDRTVLAALESLEGEADDTTGTPRPRTTERDIAARWLEHMVTTSLHRAAARSQARIIIDRGFAEWTTEGIVQ